MDAANPGGEGSHHLHRRFGLLHSTALNMSNMVGAGPFITIPLLMSAMGGPQALLGWVVAVVICLPDGMIWSELGSRLPGSGGSYVYLRDGYGRETFGRLMAFLFIWQFIISGPLEIASGYIGFAGYFRYLWQELTDTHLKLIAAGVGVLNIVLLYRRISFISHLTVTLWVGMLFTIGMVIFTGARHFDSSIAFSFGPDAFQLSWGFVWGLGAAARIGIYDYLGYYDVCYIGDEVRDPARTIPRSVLFSLVAVACIYFLMNLSIIGIEPWQNFVPADKHPESGYLVSIVMEKIYGSGFAKIFTGMILWTTFASVFALLLGYSRIPYAAAKDGYFFRAFAHLHPKHDFPDLALIAVGIIAIIACFFSLQVVIDTLLATRIVVQFMGQIGAVVLLRKQFPDQPAPYRIWLYPLPCFVAFVGWFYLLFTSGGAILAFSIGAFAVGVAAFLHWSWHTRRWPFGDTPSRWARFLRWFAIALTAMLVVIACIAGCVYYMTRTVEIPLPAGPEDARAGGVHSLTQVGRLPAPVISGLLWWSGLEDSVVTHSGATLYRVEYTTRRQDESLTIASGLLAIPDIVAKGAVSYQHGTNSNRHLTPSAPTLGEGVLASALFAGGGYILAAPDYIGLGTSTEVHPYLIANTTANTVVDLVKAARAVSETLNLTWSPHLYLTGFSQGGHATMVAHRAFEAMNDPAYQVVASAPMAGPFNLSGISFPSALEGISESDSVYLAYMASGYCHVYGHPLDSLVREPYASTLPKLFDGEHDGMAILNALPARPRDMFSPQFLDDFDHQRPTWLLTALAENDVYAWAPKAPIRLYYGDKDVDVLPKEADFAKAELEKRGGRVETVSVGPYAHDESVFHAAPKVRLWFDEVSATPN